MAKKNIFEYKGKVTYTPEEVESSVSQKTPTGTPDSKYPGGSANQNVSQQEIDYYQKLDAVADEAATIDKMFDVVNEMIEEQTKDLRIPVDPALRPATAEATKSLGGEYEGDFIIIDNKVYDRALNIMENCSKAAFGFDPVVSAFSDIGPQGLNVPKGEGIVAADCIQASDESPVSHAKGGTSRNQHNDTVSRKSSGGEQKIEDVPITAVSEQSEYNVKINTERFTSYYTKRGALRWLVKKFKNIEKVKIVGKFIKNKITNPMRGAIKWQTKKINEMMPTIPTADSGSNTSSNQEYSLGRGKQIRAIGALGEKDFLSGISKEHEWYTNEHRLLYGEVVYTDQQDDRLEKEPDDGPTDIVGVIYPANLDEMDPKYLAERKYPRLVTADDFSEDEEDLEKAPITTDASTISVPANC